MATNNISVSSSRIQNRANYTPPHFSQVAMNAYGQVDQLWEPVYLGLFEIKFILPTILRDQGRDPALLLQTATKISIGELHPDLGFEVQRFKYSTRMYMKPPSQTHLESINIEFEINQTPGSNTVPVFNTLKAWYDLGWNSQTGELHYKRELAGILIVYHHDRRGFVIRKVTYLNAMLSNLAGGPELDWGQQGIYKASGKFGVDYWLDQYVDDVGNTQQIEQ